MAASIDLRVLFDRLDAAGIGRGSKRVLVTAWAREDPQAAFAWAVSAGRADAIPTWDTLEAVGQSWGRSDPAAAWEAGQQLPEEEGARMAFLGAVLEAWALTDPASGLLHLRAAGAFQVEPESTGRLFGAWMAANPAAALGAFEALPEEHLGWGVVSEAVATAYAQRDIQGAWDWVQALPADRMADALAGVGAEWALTDPDGALEACFDRRSYRLMNAMIRTWLSRDPDGVLRWMETRRSLDRAPGPVWEKVFNRVLGDRKESDTSGRLARLVEDLPTGFLKHESARTLAQVGWEGDLAAALEWVDGLPPGTLRDDALTEVLKRQAEVDPRAALGRFTAARGLGEEEEEIQEAIADGLFSLEGARAAADFVAGLDRSGRADAAPDLAARWSGEDPDAAVDWLKSLGDPKVYDLGLTRIVWRVADEDPQKAVNLVAGRHRGPEGAEFADTAIERWAERDPEGAIAAVEALQAEGFPLAEMAPAVTRGWGRDEPEAAAAWTLGLDDDETQTAAINAFAGNWARSDPRGASGWIDRLPPGAARDHFSARLVEGVSGTDPPGAFAWAVQIADPGLRREALGHAFAAWNRLQPEMAQAAFAVADISEDDRRHVQESIPGTEIDLEMEASQLR